jgi:hypothetical protein
VAAWLESAHRLGRGGEFHQAPRIVNDVLLSRGSDPSRVDAVLLRASIAASAAGNGHAALQCLDAMPSVVALDTARADAAACGSGSDDPGLARLWEAANDPAIALARAHANAAVHGAGAAARLIRELAACVRRFPDSQRVRAHLSAELARAGRADAARAVLPPSLDLGRGTAARERACVPLCTTEGIVAVHAAATGSRRSAGALAHLRGTSVSSS